MLSDPRFSDPMFLIMLALFISLVPLLLLFIYLLHREELKYERSKRQAKQKRPADVQ